MLKMPENGTAAIRRGSAPIPMGTTPSEIIRQHNARVQRHSHAPAVAPSSARDSIAISVGPLPNGTNFGNTHLANGNAKNNNKNLAVSFLPFPQRIHPTAGDDQQSKLASTNGWCSPTAASFAIACPTSSSSSPSNDSSNAPFANHQIPGQPRNETKMSFFLQCCFPFILAGCGMIAAGILLDKASKWPFLLSVPEALVLVPALLGLKGNLEMTLASRLSTMVNLGLMDSPRQQMTALYSNVSLVQAQAIVVSLVASLLAIGTHLIEGNQFDFARSFCVILSSTMTASVASFALASLMVFLAIASHRCGLNPDNIATPLAAALGDVISLAFLIIFGTLFYNVRESALPIMVGIFCCLLASAFFWMWLAAKVQVTREVLKFGWFAVLAAMCISSGGGYVLRHAIQYFPGIGLFQPVINGVGGNLVAVQASKISTNLHQFGKLGILPANRLLTYLNPFRTFSCQEPESWNAMILLGISIPGHILFVFLLTLTGQVLAQTLNGPFILLYLFAAILQVAVLLYICQFLSRVLWKCCWNPDNNAIPLLTALGDLFGTLLLALAFLLHVRLFPEYAEIDEEMLGLGNGTTVPMPVPTLAFMIRMPMAGGGHKATELQNAWSLLPSTTIGPIGNFTTI